ncbi:LuxR C-terminal-related transcriptional regulator [Nakamurella sp.]|uniref:LuxR C-terminal-related transcriptional regulator n=1 Tax=Nakamurella sp. TaxID=1869182 RepID=UPI003B3B415D
MEPRLDLDQTANPVDPIGLFIVTPIKLYRDGLAHFLSTVDRIRVLGTATDDQAATERAVGLSPEVILLDMAARNGRELASALRSRLPGTAIVALAVPDSTGHVADCAEAGICGYVSRDGSLQDLVAAVILAHKGEAACSPRVTAELFLRIAQLADRSAQPPLTDTGVWGLTARETEVIALISAGMSNQQIARRLTIELATVKNHVHSILDKVGVRSRGEAVARLRHTDAPVASRASKTAAAQNHPDQLTRAPGR